MAQYPYGSPLAPAAPTLNGGAILHTVKKMHLLVDSSMESEAVATGKAGLSHTSQVKGACVVLSPDRAERRRAGLESATFEGFWPFCALGPVSVSAARQKARCARAYRPERSRAGKK